MKDTIKNRGTSRRPNYWLRWYGFRDGKRQRLEQPALDEQGRKCRTKDEAARALRRLQGAGTREWDELADHRGAAGVSVRELVKRFLEGYTSTRVRQPGEAPAEGARRRRWTGYHGDSEALLKHVTTALGDEPADAVTPAQIEALRDELLKTKSAQTVRHVVGRLTRAYAWGVRQRIVRRNPAASVERPAVPVPWRPIEPERYLTEAELSTLLTWTEKHAPDWHPLFSLLSLAGLRLSEAMRLRWSDVDLERGAILVREAKSGEGRSVPLHPIASVALGQWRKRPWHSDAGLVFDTGTGKVPHSKTAWLALHEALAGAKLRAVRVHDLRHSAAAALVASGSSLVETAAILGHRRLETTRRYVHLAPDALRAAVARVRVERKAT